MVEVRPMTPAAHWSPDEYYRASRGARAAWERQDHQLTLAAESADSPSPQGHVRRAAPWDGILGAAIADSGRGSPSAASVSVLSDSPALAMLGLDTDEVKRAASYGADGIRPAAAASSVSSPPAGVTVAGYEQTPPSVTPHRLPGGAGSLPPEERSL